MDLGIPAIAGATEVREQEPVLLILLGPSSHVSMPGVDGKNFLTFDQQFPLTHCHHIPVIYLQLSLDGALMDNKRSAD